MSICTSSVLSIPARGDLACDSRWVLDDDDNPSIASVFGREFARSVASQSVQTRSQSDISSLSDRRKKKKEYPPFKQIFWDEPRYNPPIGNTHQSHEFDAQYNEINAHWKRSGKKFSDEPRIAKETFREAPGGPDKPMEFPQCFEQPVKYWGRERYIHPLERAHMYTKPHDRSNAHNRVV